MAGGIRFRYKAARSEIECMGAKFVALANEMKRNTLYGI